MDADRSALARAFRDTEVHVWAGRRHLVVAPASAGTTSGPYPEDASVVHVVTAWNPGGRRADPAANARADRALREEVRARGWTAWDAEGWAPDDSWAEESLALVDADEAEVLALARRFGQAAVYRWTPAERAVVWCDDRPDDVHGWSATELRG